MKTNCTSVCFLMIVYLLVVCNSASANVICGKSIDYVHPEKLIEVVGGDIILGGGGYHYTKISRIDSKGNLIWEKEFNSTFGDLTKAFGEGYIVALEGANLNKNGLLD